MRDRFRCCGQTETLPFGDRLIILWLIFVIYLMPLLLVQRSSGAGFVVSGCFHLVLLAATVAIAVNGLIIDRFLHSTLRQYEAQAFALGASEAHIRALRSNDAPEQSMIELLHYLAKSYRQLRRVTRRLGADKHQVDSALAMDS